MPFLAGLFGGGGAAAAGGTAATGGAATGAAGGSALSTIAPLALSQAGQQQSSPRFSLLPTQGTGQTRFVNTLLSQNDETDKLLKTLSLLGRK
jgi:hypothetical protein